MRHAILAALLLLANGAAVAAEPAQRTLTFEDRVKAQEAIERVYYSHQIGATKPFEQAVPRAVLESKVHKYLNQTAALKVYWKTAVTDEMLQRELERMASGTRMPERLLELYAALGNDPFLVKECLARAALVDRLARDRYSVDPNYVNAKANWVDWWATSRIVLRGEPTVAVASDRGLLPRPKDHDSGGANRDWFGTNSLPCVPDDTWEQSASTNQPESRYQHTAVWTGSVMVVWGGGNNSIGPLNTGGLYDPATDSWTPMAVVNAPAKREFHTAVWTGSQMVVWGGVGSGYLNTGGRYDPATDSWTPTSTTGAPSARDRHSAVWTGSLMVVWGGYDNTFLNTGARYDPANDSWISTTTIGAPTSRYRHNAVWTGSRMVVWGGDGGSFLNTGGRYDPANDTWIPTSTTSAPTAHYLATAVWTGSIMIVWGGYDGTLLNTGGRYDPANDTWMPTATTGAPSGRFIHTAVWTGSQMVVWGGYDGGSPSPYLNTGGLYDLATDSWTPTSTTSAPSRRYFHTAVWTGSVMEVWGGTNGSDLNTGGRYVLGASLDNDGDTFSECQGDCNDASSAVYPGAPEICDGRKNDCNAAGPATPPNEADADGDSIRTCQSDCNDNDSSIYPDAPQLCDGRNNNCSDPSWPIVPTNEANADGDAFRICEGDCNDTDATVYPDAPQLCDGKNNNCADPSWPAPPANEADADWDGYRVCQNDCNDVNPVLHPGAAEDCDGIDNDCTGQIDDDAQGVDSDADGLHNVCDNCRFLANPTQIDGDGDHVGNACDNCINTPNADQLDADTDGRGNACDNCSTVPNGFQDDTDIDRVGDACDNCTLDFNPSQSDFNHDGEGDMCDFNDGLIYVYSTDRNYREWQAEMGYTTWNSYQGSLAVLRGTGQYTQVPGSNPQAVRDCGLSDPYVFDPLVPGPGAVAFNLVTGVTGGVESSLGTNSAGVPRANANPCP